MRKYDSKNKRNIGIIIGICIIFAVIFSYFLIKEIKVSKIKYELEQSTVLFDIDKNTILLNNTGTIKKKWNQKYYLTYEEEQYNIGTHVIAFNNNDISLYLYGEFYQINSNSEVEITKEETILNNLGISRFYKIADRKYLIVDQNIRTADEALKTTNYLIVELDKQGNAILYNNSLNVKVFSATKILTSTYTFDIANEMLIFANDKVDLKKILGTTNEYKEEEPKEEKPTDSNQTDNDGTGGGGNTGTGEGTGTTIPGTDDTGNTGNNNTGDDEQDNDNNGGNDENDNSGNDGENPDDDIITEEPDTGTEITPGEIINQTSKTSIIRIIPYTNSISIDYVIYDKTNEYLSTFVEIRNKDGLDVVHLPRSSTNVTLTDLKPGTNYELTFKYTHILNDMVAEETIDTHNITTLIPTITLTGTKVTSRRIEYKVTISSYSIDSAIVNLYVNGTKQGEGVPVSGNNITGKINISEITLPSKAEVEIRLEDIYVAGTKVNKTASWSYIAPIIIDPNPETPSEGDNQTPDTPEDDKTEENTKGEDAGNE